MSLGVEELPASCAQGIWHGRWYEWACSQCHAAMASREPAEHRRCPSCRAEGEIQATLGSLRAILSERDAWRTRALRAEQASEAHLDAVADRDEKIATLQTMLGAR